MRRTLLHLCALVASAWLPGQDDPAEARLDLGYLKPGFDRSARPRWLPGAEASPLDLLVADPGQRHGNRLLDFVSHQTHRAVNAPQRVRVSRQDDEVVLATERVPAARLAEEGSRVLGMWLPKVEFAAALLPSVDSASAMRAPAEEFERFAMGAAPDRWAASCATRQQALLVATLDDEQAIVHVEPHEVAGGDRLGLVVEFEYRRPLEEGGSVWRSGLASGLVGPDQVLLLRFGDRVLALRARHTPMHPAGLRQSSWSLATTPSRQAVEGAPFLGGDPWKVMGFETSGAMRYETRETHQLRQTFTNGQQSLAAFIDPYQLLVSGPASLLEELEPDLHAKVLELIDAHLGRGALHLETTHGAVTIPVLSHGQHALVEAELGEDGQVVRGTATTLFWRRPDGKKPSTVDVRRLVFHGPAPHTVDGDPLRRDAFALEGEGQLFPAAVGLPTVSLRIAGPDGDAR